MRGGSPSGLRTFLALLLASTVAVDPAGAADSYAPLLMPIAVVLSTVVLSSALAESDRAHRRRSTIDTLTGLRASDAIVVLG